MDRNKPLSDVLSEFARTMVTDFPIQRILDRLVERIVDVLPIEAAGVSLISPGIHPRYIAASNDSALRYERLQSTLGEGPCVLAFQSGQAVSVPDLRLEDRFPVFGPQALKAGLTAVFTFPLNHGDRRLGALDLYRDTAGPLSTESLADAQTLADVASAYILNAQARDDLLESSSASRKASLHDGLTGLPNRVLFMDRLEHAFSRSRRSGTLSAVLFLDLDRFKSINDLYGHRVGDELLIAVAARLMRHLRPGDTLARLSGDEFVILCEGLESREQATALGMRLQAGIDEPFDVAGRQVRVTSSIGVAIAPPDQDDPDQILHQADMAMYEAKRQGGGRSRLFDPDDSTHLGLEQDLRDAAARGELRTAFQPIVTTSTGRITGFEALLRWDHPTRGVVAPAITIPMAERAGLIVDIGRWVLSEAWAAWDRWHRMPGGRDLTMAVNVSPHQLTAPGFVDTLYGVVGDRTTDMYSLTLDVTESVLVTDSSRALMVMNDLKELGVSLALDDFGAGYASINYLRRFPLDILKVDRGFISALGADETSESIVSAVAQLAHGLGMNVIAEGVETAEQRTFASRLGCDSSQGYYFAEPMSAGEVSALIAQHGSAGPSLPGPGSRPVPAQRSARQPRSVK
jgi:diguanylate cyclase (GGDEF)-like protein